MALNKGAGVVRVAHLCLLRLAADVDSSVIIEVHNRGSRVFSDEVLDDLRHADVTDHGHCGVRRPQVNAIHLVAHARVPS